MFQKEMLFKNIYKYSPFWFQDIMISIYGYKIYKQRYGVVYKRNFKKLIKKNYTNYKNEVFEQEEELQIFLRKVLQKSVFYKNLYKDIDITKIKTIKDLKNLPIVDKETLRANINDVYTIDGNKAIKTFTGGTTGKSLKVLFDKNDFQKRMAYLDAFKYKVGIKNQFQAKKATFSGRDIITNHKTTVFWRNNYIYKQRLYSTFDLSEKNMPYYITNLNKYKPEIINGFVSAIYEIADYLNRNNIFISFRPKAIFTTSETLLPFHRVAIEKAFSAPIYNQYASAEGAPFVTECKFRNLHYNLNTGVIETIKTPEGDQMVITSFTTSGTPLIRYNIEDCITFKKGECKCGSKHPLVDRIEGRKVDFLYSKEKGKISLSHLADVIKGVPNSIKKMQFIQESEETIIVLIVIDSNLFKKEHNERIMSEMIYRFGNDIEIKIKQVDEIPREKSGKYLLIKKKVK